MSDDTYRTLTVLRESRELISDRKRWTRLQDARDRHSHRVPVDSRRACRWCAQGAVERTGGLWGLVNAMSPLDRQAKRLDPEALNATWFNDHHSHGDVLEMFDRAISALEAA